MCAIVGFAGFFDTGLIRRMLQMTEHRGPDEQNALELPEQQMALGINRLAIIDISGGTQPKQSDDGKVIVIFNGEIYNFSKLRDTLIHSGSSLKTHSDIEVILHSYLQWGTKAWQQLQGMFAIAIIDLRFDHPRLILVRDRIGIKPLYYYHQAEKLLFSSEMKAILAWRACDRALNQAALRDYLRLRYVPGDHSLFKYIHKLPAAHELIWENNTFQINRWWQPPTFQHREKIKSFDEAVSHFGDVFQKTVRNHMISDVPVGAFLSSGIDSSTIVACMSRAASQPIHTYSIGFPEFTHNECDSATRLAQHFGTQHTNIECTYQAMENLPNIIWHLDEPIGDPIVVPMFQLAKEASRSVKVVLSGEGADELLGGYLFHKKITQLSHWRRYLPRGFWTILHQSIHWLPLPVLNYCFDYPGKLGRDGKARVRRFIKLLKNSSTYELYQNSIALFEPEELHALLNPHELPSNPNSYRDSPGTGSTLQQLIAAQYQHWLPDDILMKFDKMTMAHSVEGRVPFLDEAVIDCLAQTPDRYKMTFYNDKRILRAFAKTCLPPEWANMPKKAFYLPLETAITQPPLKNMVEDTLNEASLRKRGLLSPRWVKQTLQNSKDSKNTGFLPAKKLFSLMALEYWFQQYCPNAHWPSDHD